MPAPHSPGSERRCSRSGPLGIDSRERGQPWPSSTNENCAVSVRPLELSGALGPQAKYRPARSCGRRRERARGGLKPLNLEMFSPAKVAKGECKFLGRLSDDPPSVSA
jgi:hypothetical protein